MQIMPGGDPDSPSSGGGSILIDEGINMRIGIDLDNTITVSEQSIRFFRGMTHLLLPEHEIHIITNRDPHTEKATKQELADLGIAYSKLIITGEKAEYVVKTGIQVLVEDTDEYFVDLPESVLVFKIREPGNFDFAEKKWIGSDKTTRMIQ